MLEDLELLLRHAGLPLAGLLLLDVALLAYTQAEARHLPDKKAPRRAALCFLIVFIFAAAVLRVCYDALARPDYIQYKYQIVEPER